MKKKRNTPYEPAIKTRIADVLITLMCILGILLAGNHVYHELFGTLNEEPALPIGSLTRAYNAVLRQSPDNILWNKLTPESTVNNGDIIKTGSLSDAVITFANGNSAGLSENCVARITMDENSRIRIELSGGSISAEAKRTGLVITHEGQNITIASRSVAQVVCDGKGALILRVVEGRVTLNTDGNIRLVTEGTVASTVSGTANTSAGPEETVSVVVHAPLPNHEILSAIFPVPLLFSWTVANFRPENHIRIDIALDRRFFRIIHTIDAAFSGVSVNLDEGTYWWRAYPVRDGSGSEQIPTSAAEVSTGTLCVRRAPQ
jgi:hypothetical protein